MLARLRKWLGRPLPINTIALANVAKAVREIPVRRSFTMREFGFSESMPSCPLGCYAMRSDLQDVLIGVDVRDTPFLSLRWTHSGEPVTLADPQLATYFGITTRDIWMLFGTNGCGGARSPEAAAQFIERFIADPEAARAEGEPFVLKLVN